MNVNDGMKRFIETATDHLFLPPSRLVTGARAANRLVNSTQSEKIIDQRTKDGHLVEQPSDRRADLKAALKESISSELSFPEFNRFWRPSSKNVASAYIACTEQMDTLSRQAFGFFSDAVFTSLVYQREASERALTWLETSQQMRPEQRNPSLALVGLTDDLMKAIGFQHSTRMANLEAELLVTLSPKCLHAYLKTALNAQVERFAGSIFKSLDSGTEQAVFGLMDRVGETACRFYFVKRLLHDRMTTTFSSVDVERTNKVALHIHDLVDISFHSLPARWVPAPVWVRTLYRSVPPFMRRVPGLVQVVSGERTLERIIERDVKGVTEYSFQHDFHCDPALLIDNVVVAGWDDADLKSERDYVRQWGLGKRETRKQWSKTSECVRFVRDALKFNKRVR